MIKKIFLDSDVILDLLLERGQFFRDIALVFEKAKTGGIILYTSSICVLNINYLLRKSYSKDAVEEIMNKFLQYVKILAVDSAIIMASLNSNFNDLEDGVQYYCSLNNGINEILTRNIKDYRHSKIPVLTPLEFLESKSNDLS